MTSPTFDAVRGHRGLPVAYARLLAPFPHSTADRVGGLGARSLRGRGFRGCEVSVLEDGSRQRSTAENGAQLIAVGDQTVLGPKLDDRFGLRLADTAQFEQLAALARLTRTLFAMGTSLRRLSARRTQAYQRTALSGYWTKAVLAAV